MLKAVGIVRRVDELGRFIIPVELRRLFGIRHGDALEIYMDADQIVLKKYQPGCIFCGTMSANPIMSGREELICDECRVKITLAGTADWDETPSQLQGSAPELEHTGPSPVEP